MHACAAMLHNGRPAGRGTKQSIEPGSSAARITMIVRPVLFLIDETPRDAPRPTAASGAASPKA